MSVYTSKFTNQDTPVYSTDGKWVCVFKTPAKALAHAMVEAVCFFFQDEDNKKWTGIEHLQLDDAVAHETYYHDWEVWIKRPVSKSLANKITLFAKGFANGWIARGAADYALYHQGTPGA